MSHTDLHLVQLTGMGAEGREHPQKSAENLQVIQTGGAESGAVGGDLAHFDPELRGIIDAWPNLPPAVKAGILAMVRAV